MPALRPYVARLEKEQEVLRECNANLEQRARSLYKAVSKALQILEHPQGLTAEAIHVLKHALDES